MILLAFLPFSVGLNEKLRNLLDNLINIENFKEMTFILYLQMAY